jgi:4-hydroxybenzoyl-CoA reductase subunit alpha
MGIRGGSQATIKLNEDGGATVISGVVDNGQGNDNMLVQITAEELGIRPEDVQLVTADTEVTSSDPGAYSQVSTFIGGHAVKNAAENVRKQLFDTASKVLKVDPDHLMARDRMICVKGSPTETGIPLKKVIRMILASGKSVSGQGEYWPKVDPKREWVKNPFGQMCGAFSFGTTVAEVEVDSETGKVKVIEVTVAQDVGFALNPLVIEGQFQGSIAMGGQGGILTEGHVWDKGSVLNPTQLEYKVPLACDMPKINTIIVESNDPEGPYGTKESGMSIAMSAAQAYAAAVSNAIGVYMTDFPLTPDKVLEALQNKMELETSNQNEDVMEKSLELVVPAV